MCIYLKMEKALRKELDELMSQPSVSGVLLVDSSGLCISAEGCASASSAGLVSALASQAADIRRANKDASKEPESPSLLPVVVLESDTYQMTIKSSAGITTAIYKNISPKESRDASASNTVHVGR
jgi:Ragulator complex protein LAMTOR5